MKETNKMNCTILDYFNKLRSEVESERAVGGIELLKYLLGQASEQNDSKEFKYAIKRLIQGLGSSKTSSRVGFYTTLTVFLVMYSKVSIEEFLSIVDNELHPVNSNSKGENADIYMGRILAYGALIRSKMLSKSTVDIQMQIVQELINRGKQRSYLSFPSTSFLIEFVNQIHADDIKKVVWPIVEKEFGKPWTEQTIDTFYTLLSIKGKCPPLVNHEFSKKHFGTEDIITKESMSNITKVLMDLPKVILCHHPVYKLFCENLTSAELVTDFWSCVDQKFTKPTKIDEYMAEVLHLLVSATNSNDTNSKTQYAVLKKLILYPGDLMIEKKTGIKVIQIITGNLNLDSIKKVSKLYRDIIENKMPKEKSNMNTESFWTNAERIYAAHLLTRLMGHSATFVDQKWRLSQLKFLFTHGLCEMSNVGVDLAPQLKETFYHALDHKLPKLKDLRNILSELVHYLNIHLKNKTLKLRNPLTNEANIAWEKVICLIKKLENNSKKAEAVPVFHTMNLHMGLQLFSDPRLAIMAITELESCYERLLKKSKKYKGGSDKDDEDEPEWVEVVVDLLLSFYSRNDHLLRSLVGCVFPHIYPYITPAAIHKILEVLDVRNEKKLFVAKDDLDEESSGTESNFDSEDEEETSNDGTESSSDDNDSDSNEESLNEDENETVTDRLRMAVRQALGDASVQTEDEDIDVDEINEEDGKRLDESLSAVFRNLRENRQTRSKKQEKYAQALTHFRIRVIDLLETYLECGPSMAVVLDMLLPLFALLEYCIKDPHQKPLQDRIRSCLKKLAAVKKFKDTENIDEDVLITILKALIEKGERTTSVYQEMSDKLAECCIFLVRCAQQVDISTDSIVNIYVENLTAFFTRRDCVLPPMLFKSILQLHWEGNWQLAPLLVNFAFDNTVRSFRRGHALDLLTTFYNNGRLVRLDTKHSGIRMKMEKKLCKNVISTLQELSNAHKAENEQPILKNGNEIGKEVKQRYVYLLLSLLRNVYTQHLPKAWDWEAVGNALTTYRTHASLAKCTKVACTRLAAQIGISFNISKKKDRNERTSKINGETINTINDIEKSDIVQENGNSHSDTDTDTPTLTKSELKKKKKNKSKNGKDKQLLKKEARTLREKAMSEGFESFNFSSFSLHDKNNESEPLQNGNSQNERFSSNSSQKRMLKHTSDGNKSKRRKHLETA
ncbi:myb-binding protein 1A isoform X2 [Colletes gigas]|uniref:myb-binding protein 1A isoform X2 n=1 Tax=Colletes gigas TaxID=935657 RepID=UPI001C9B68E5|nr:myb-binding protein 1A isoform X2 [Colletes gigas]